MTWMSEPFPEVFACVGSPAVNACCIRWSLSASVVVVVMVCVPEALSYIGVGAAIGVGVSTGASAESPVSTSTGKVISLTTIPAHCSLTWASLGSPVAWITSETPIGSVRMVSVGVSGGVETVAVISLTTWLTTSSSEIFSAILSGGGSSTSSVVSCTI